jgi:UDP-N-acetylglucosamine transferase subunit ALG13
MIFVTVGTHEQPFDRLVKGIDRLKETGAVRQDVFIQTGYTSYKPQFCEYKEFIRFDEMMKRMTEAEIVITHGGTGSIMLVLYHQKIPVVMPRQKKYNEHIDDHQVMFCKLLESKRKIIAAYEVEDLGQIINNYFQNVQGLQIAEAGHELNEKAGIFSQRLNDICVRLVDKKLL